MAKRDQHGPKGGATSTTWADVAVLQRQLADHLGLTVVLSLQTCPPGYSESTMWACVSAHEPSSTDWVTAKHRVSGPWPNRQSATLAGQFIRLMHQMDHMAWHQAQLLEGEAPF